MRHGECPIAAAAVRGASAALFACLVAGGAPARAQEPPDFTDLSLEDLGRVDLVHAASRHEQTRGEAPSSVSIVTSEEIGRHGYRTLADVLRSLGSFYVSDDRNYSYIGVRGFGRPGDYNTRVLILMDGIRTNEPVYDGTYVGREFNLAVAVIDRIEVIRGPGATMYGNSAFFAVINVVTKQGRQLRGGEVSASIGSFRDVGGQLTWGTVTPRGIDILASVSATDLEGRRLYFPEFDSPETGNGVADRLDGEKARNVFLRVAKGGWSVRAAHVLRDKDVPTASYGTLFGEPTHTRDGATILSGGFDGAVSKSLLGTIRVQYGASRYDGVYQYETGPWEENARGRWWGADWNVTTTRTGRHTVTAGGELVHNFRIQQQVFDQGVPGLDSQDPSLRWGLYAQDEIKLGSSLLASVGLRHDRYDSFGGHTSPRLGLIVNPAGPTTVKALFGTAFRAPNAYELHYYREAALEPETIRTGELIVERALGRGVHGSVSAFWNDIDGLIALDGDGEGELFFRNADPIRSRGFEASLEARRRGVAARASYSFQRSSDRLSGAALTNSPRHLGKLSVSAPFASRFSAAVDAQYMSARGTLAGDTTPGVVRFDLHLTARAITPRLETALSIRNLTDAAYADPGSEEHLQDVLPQDGRTLALSLIWRF